MRWFLREVEIEVEGMHCTVGSSTAPRDRGVTTPRVTRHAACHRFSTLQNTSGRLKD
jgi:hypothetical protein